MFPHSSPPPLKSTRNKTGLGAITAAALGHEINLSHVLAEVCCELHFFCSQCSLQGPFTGIVAPCLSHNQQG